MRAIVLFFLLSGILSACGEQEVSNKNEADQKLQIVSTIKPVQLIVSAIAGDTAIQHQLIPDYANPHHYNFKPSDIRKLNEADIIFRIDEHMEVMLNSAFTGMNNKMSPISLAEIKGVNLIEVSGKLDEGDHNDHSHENTDLHIWTSPNNAKAMAQVIAKVLIDKRPEDKALYQLNLNTFQEEIDKLNETLLIQLKSLKQKPYIVFHNSWQYFARDFDLQEPLIVNVQEGISSGAKTLSNIKTQIASQNIKCIFSDSTTSKAQLKRVFDFPENQVFKLDVLANSVDIKRDNSIQEMPYITWLKTFSSQVSTCLAL